MNGFAPAEIAMLVASGAVAASWIVLALWSVGHYLLSGAEEREQIARARIWREKRRELRDSIVSRRIA